MFCIKYTKISQLLKKIFRLAEEEHGRLDVEHGVEVLQQKLLLVVDLTGGELLDGLGEPGELLDGEGVAPEDELVVHGLAGEGP